jgi:ATP-dependent Clp protease ATP-binding subunit ClpA
MKIQYSDSLILVWRIAEIEARHLQSPAIEPPHLLLGLCKAVDLDLPSLVSKDAPNRNEIIEELLREVRRLKSVFRAAGLDAKTFRRRLRQPAANRRFELSDSDRMHRSDAAKQVFADAEHLATLAGSVVYPAHLLYAVLLAEDDKRDEIFGELGIAKNPLQEAAKREVLFQRGGSAFASGKGRAKN